MRIKILLGIFLVFAFVGIFFLTFQSSEGTTTLSNGFRQFLIQLGITVDQKTLRHIIHLPEYFFYGMILCYFIHLLGGKRRWAILIGFLTALVDEGIKVLLPTREFDVTDLLLDCTGILLATFLVWVLTRKHPVRDEGRSGE